MKKILVMLMLVGNAHGAVEFAEINTYSKKELISFYCEKSELLSRLITTNAPLSEFKEANDDMNTIYRLLKRKFKIEGSVCKIHGE